MNIKTLFSVLSLILVLACKGGGSSDSGPTNPGPKPSPKTYGTFRALKTNAPQAMIVGVQAANASTTMSFPRAYHRSHVMMNGKVLLVGGQGTLTMDIFDPATETFQASAALMHNQRTHKWGTTWESYRVIGMCNLPDGKVVIAGGASYQDPSDDLTSIDVYDPVTDTMDHKFMAYAPNHISEVLYAGDNKIFVFDYSTSFLVDLQNKDSYGYQVTTTVPGIPNGSIVMSAITTDDTGNLWVFGGQVYTQPGVSLDSVYKFDIATQTWTTCAPLKVGRHLASVVSVGGTKIGVYGGYVNGAATDSVEIYDIATQVSTLSVPLTSPRYSGEVNLLQTGYTLYAGGLNPDGSVSDSELVHKSDTSFAGSTGSMLSPRMGHCVTSLPNGLVLITGGKDAQNITIKTGEIYDAESKLYIKYTSDTLVAGTTMQMSSDYVGSITWSIEGQGATISETGLVTTQPTDNGYIKVKAQSVSDPSLQATIKLLVIQP